MAYMNVDYSTDVPLSSNPDGAVEERAGTGDWGDRKYRNERQNRSHRRALEPK